MHPSLIINFFFKFRSVRVQKFLCFFIYPVFYSQWTLNIFSIRDTAYWTTLHFELKKDAQLVINDKTRTRFKFLKTFLALRKIYTEKLFISIFTIVFFNLGKTVSLWEFLLVKILNLIIMIWNFSINYSKICYELCWIFISLL